MSTTTPAFRSAARSLGFALVFAVAVLLGRTTIMDGTSLSLVWPAAGVSAAWFAVQRDAGTRRLAVALLALLTWSLNVATGAGPVLAAFFVLANFLQVEVFVVLLRRWCPHLWGAGGREPLTGTRTLARLLGAALVATAAGGLIGPTAAALAAGAWSWLPIAVWMVRNSVAIALITVLVLRVGHVLGTRRDLTGTAQASSRRLPFLVPTGWRSVELAAALAASAVAYLGVFWFAHGLPLAFLPLALTVWIALRFDTTLVTLHDFLISCVAVLFTLAGGGPFAAIADPATRALVVRRPPRPDRRPGLRHLPDPQGGLLLRPRRRGRALHRRPRRDGRRPLRRQRPGHRPRAAARLRRGADPGPRRSAVGGRVRPGPLPPRPRRRRPHGAAAAGRRRR